MSCSLKGGQLSYVCSLCGETHEAKTYGLDHSIPRIHAFGCWLERDRAGLPQTGPSGVWLVVGTEDASSGSTEQTRVSGVSPPGEGLAPGTGTGAEPRTAPQAQDRQTAWNW